jgi:nucleoid-associated protein YgaU
LVIQPGNSLWKLSREVYGKGRMYTIIYEANRDQLKNPNKIFPGQILTAPMQN